MLIFNQDGNNMLNWIFVLALVAQTFPYRQILPYIVAGQTITIMNDEPNDQTVRIRTYSGVRDYPAAANSVITIPTSETGYALVESDKTNVRAYATVQGTTIPAMYLNTYSRSLRVTPKTGIAIANPWNVLVTITFEQHVSGSVSRKSIQIMPGAYIAGFYRDIVAPVDKQSLVFILSSMPVGVGAAECIKDICESAVVGSMGVREIGPVN